MATKTTGSMTVKSGVNSTVDNPQTYDDVFTTKYTFTEAAGAGANAFKIHSDTATVAISLKGTGGDVLVIDGYSGDYTAKLSGSKLTLDNNNQIITVALAAKSIVKLQFLDDSKDVNLVDKTLGGESLATKTGVLHINGMNSHELTSVTNAVKAALTDTNKKYYATVDAAIISDNAVVKSTALTDKLGKSYATVDAAITSNDAIIAAQTLTDTSVTPNVIYPNLAAAITSNDSAIVSQALNGTGFSNMADFIAAYNKFVNQTLTTFRVETLNPATMQPATAVSVSEGATAYFKVSLTNRGAGDYSVKTMLTGTTATLDNDFVSSLTLDNASIAAGIKFNPTTGILTIPASSQSVSAILSTAIKNDTVSPEAGEKVNLALFDAQGTSVAPLGITDIASVTILDVPPPTFSVTPNTGPVSEGATTTFTVSLANHAVGDYSVKVSLTGNNAVLNSDFSALTLDPATLTSIKFDTAKGILTIPADAKTTSVKFNTTINTDNRAETGQSVTFALSQDATNSTNVNTLITPTASATTTVITDTTPAFSVAAGSTTVDKGKEASFSISLANASTGDYKVNLAATTLNSSILNTLALDSTNSNSGITFDGSILTIPAATITAANKQPIKAVLTSLTNPIDSTSISLALSNPTGANIAAAPAPATIGINNVPATLLTKDIDNIITPDNSNTLIIGNTLTINSNATLFDSIKDSSINDNDVLNISTNSWPLTALTTPAGTAKAISIDSIETINLTALDSVNVDMSAIKNAKLFNLKDSTAPVTLWSISDATMDLGLSGSLVNDLNAKYKTGLVKTTDTLNVTLDNATNASLVVTSDKPFGFATMNIIGTSSLKLFDASNATPLLSTLTISGNGALTVQSNALKYIQDIELSNTNVIKFGTIGDPTAQSSYPYLTTFKAPTNTGGITTGLIQGATGGFTMQLGLGADNITVQDNAAASTNINDIRLGAGNDSLTFTKGVNGNTYISGEDGNDTINIGGVSSSASSINTIDGGNGDDKITVGVSGSYLISGGTGSDVITDGAGSNVIDGGADADTITGGAGNDTITGGTGSDTIYVDSGTDTITDFKVGEDTLIISSGATAKVSFAGNSAVSYATVGNAGILDVTLATISTVIGSTGIDSITGSIGADSIDGGLGNDIINAGDGNDTIIGGDGSDSIDGGSGDDTITAGNGVDTINGGAGNDVIKLTLAQLFANHSIIDTIDGGAGTADLLLLTDTENSVIIASNDIFNHVQNVEQIKTVANSYPISISINATNNATAGFNTIDLSGDTNANGINVINSTDSNGISTIIGSAGIDLIALNKSSTSGSAPAATITGGGGADVFDIGNGSNQAQAQVETITIGGTIQAGDVITIIGLKNSSGAIISPIKYTIGSSDSDTSAVATAIEALLTASAANAVTTRSNNVLTITAKTAGTSIGTITTNIQQPTITASDVHTTANVVALPAATPAVTAVKQVETITIGGTIQAGDVITITGLNDSSGTIISPIKYTIGSSDSDTSAVATAIKLLLNASTANAVTTSSNNVLTITANTAGTSIGTITANIQQPTITANDVHTAANLGVITNTITDLSGTDTLKVWQYSTVNATVTADYTAASAINAGTINISTAGFVVNMAAETGSTGSISITNTGSATTLMGGAGSNTINGGVGNDTINGGAGSATINGGAGNDMITAGAAGTNSITGGYGDDTIVGSAGIDTINVDYGTDTIINFTSNTDVLNINYYATASVFAFTLSTGGTSNYTNITNNGILYVNGATLSNGTTVTGAEIITGSTGVDSIVGGAGSDIITGGAGVDTLTGGNGVDTFKLAATTLNGIDLITDFGKATATSPDVLSISLTGYAGTSGTTGYISALKDGGAVAVTTGSPLLIKVAAAATTLATGDNIIELTGATFANAAAVQTAIEAGGSRALTFASATTAGDDILLIWSDGTLGHVSAVNIGSAATTITSGQSTVTDLVTLTGVTSIASGDFLGTNFALVA